MVKTIMASSGVPLIRRKSSSAQRVVPHTAAYLRDNNAGVIRSRPAVLRDHKDEVRAAWKKTAALAMDIIQNSGRIRGAADQVVADTIGNELRLNYQPNLKKFGFSDDEAKDFIESVRRDWKLYAWNAAEVDFRGKQNLSEMLDVSVRWDMAFGEVTGLIDFFSQAQRKKYKIKTGTKLLMINPARLTQETDLTGNLYQGVRHDENGRVQSYRFSEKVGGGGLIREYPAMDVSGHKIVLHVYDALSSGDVRGITRLAAAFRQHLQHETLVDVTLQTMVLQTVFAVTLTSKNPSIEAFEGLLAMGEHMKDNKGSANPVEEYMGWWGSKLDRAASDGVSIGTDPRVSHLAHDEEMDFKSVQTPGEQFLPLSKSLSRDMARAIGITYGGLTMDHSDATYASVRMESASIWPIVSRRRERIPAPIAQSVFESWLDEMVGTGRINFKPGYEVFAANRDELTWANWQGPPAPSADDKKSAEADTEQLANGTTSLTRLGARQGFDQDEIFEERLAEHNKYIAAGMPSPYDPKPQNNSEPSTQETS